jgi:hypothetical protein
MEEDYGPLWGPPTTMGLGNKQIVAPQYSTTTYYFLLGRQHFKKYGEGKKNQLDS